MSISRQGKKFFFTPWFFLITIVLNSTFAIAETSRLASMKLDTGLTDTARLNSKFTLSEFPEKYIVQDNRALFHDATGRTIYLTIVPKMQAELDLILKTYKPAYGALVVMDPQTGAILAAGGNSRTGVAGNSILGTATFPAASLIKVITAAAAVERGRLNSDSVINFRGNAHSLTPASYFPSPALDRSRMTLGDALGKSCNPVFARLALNNLEPSILRNYAERFGFNFPLQADFPIQQSKFWIGPTDYDYARAAAGYDGTRISPIHAASMVSAIGNGGQILSPYLISEVLGADGALIFKNSRHVVSQAVTMGTASELRQMMLETTETGTARKHFKSSVVPVAGKTGTLMGDQPKGLYHWFIGVAPAANPTIAISALVVDMGKKTLNASGLASRFLDNYFRQTVGLPRQQYIEPVTAKRSRVKKVVYSKPILFSKSVKSVKPHKRSVKKSATKKRRG